MSIKNSKGLLLFSIMPPTLAAHMIKISGLFFLKKKSTFFWFLRSNFLRLATIMFLCFLFLNKLTTELPTKPL